jgi:hypothetical protein
MVQSKPRFIRGFELNEKRTNFPYTSNKKSNTHIGLIMQFTKREKKIATNFTD